MSADKQLWWAPTRTGRTLHLTDDHAGLVATGRAAALCRSGREPVVVLARTPTVPRSELAGAARWSDDVPDDPAERAVAVAAWQEIAAALVARWQLPDAMVDPLNAWLRYWAWYREGSIMAPSFDAERPEAPAPDTPPGLRARLTEAGGSGITGRCGRCTDARSAPGVARLGYRPRTT